MDLKNGRMKLLLLEMIAEVRQKREAFVIVLCPIGMVDQIDFIGQKTVDIKKERLQKLREILHEDYAKLVPSTSAIHFPFDGATIVEVPGIKHVAVIGLESSSVTAVPIEHFMNAVKGEDVE